MSRGGGRGGFGRGGGGAGQTGAMQLVSFDLLKDLGSGNLFNVNTALFPEMDVPIPRKPTSNEVQEWKLRKEYLNMIKESPFHLVAPSPPPDIVRYSDKYKVVIQKRTLREIETNLDFFPDELQITIDSKRRKKKPKATTIVDEYGQIEALLNAEGKDGEEEEEDENGEKKDGDEDAENDDEFEDEEEMVDDNDYGQNYFDNGEDDDVDDDDGEDTYS